MEQADLEALAARLRSLAGLAADEFVLAIDIAERLLGRGRVVYGHAALPARLVDTTIVVPKGHRDLNFAVAHECAEWALRELAGWRCDDHAATERAANSLAAAMLAPAALVELAHVRYGERLRPIASLFGLSQTAIVLRIAEVKTEDRAVVTATGNVLVRARRFDRDVILQAARAPRCAPGLARARLRGGIDEGRIALRVK